MMTMTAKGVSSLPDGLDTFGQEDAPLMTTPDEVEAAIVDDLVLANLGLTVRRARFIQCAQ
jgi:hypothetical protein